ncbi:MAG: ion transporter [Hyphomicrobiaceae bacterium]|nr:ion transporter [Hyphomicrobiaceae bacterium]MCC0011180.1 ion transporter [Hyphomicrobiaceae bacterium]
MRSQNPHPDTQRSASETLRKRVYEIIETGRGEDRASKIFDGFIVTLILLNVFAFVAETVHEVEAAYRTQFRIFEIFSVAVFTLEYMARLWVAVEVPFLSRLSPLKARIEMAKRPALIIDLLAFLPFYLSQIFAIDLRMLRVLRLLRFLKLSRYSPAMHTLIRVLSNERRALAGAGLLLIAAMLFAASGMYYLEHAAQPEKFGTIPDAMWWAIATLTTVGYGDVSPITGLGRIFGGFVMIIGLCVLALPVAIISTGFAQELNRRDFVINWSLMSRIPLLAELDATAVAAIIPMLQAHNYPPNLKIIVVGSPGDAIYFVASGRIVRHTKNSTRSFQTGDVFGTVAMIHGDFHHAEFQTASRCRLLKLHREDFLRLEMTQPTLTSFIRKLAEERVENEVD